MMENKSLLIVIVAIFLSVTCYAHNDKYEHLHNYILSHCKAPKSIIDQCGWQLALVKLTIDKEGRVINYSCLNPVADSLSLAFKPLLNYRFPAKLKMKSKTFVFAETYYNLLTTCTTMGRPDIEYIFPVIYQCMVKQFKLNPQTIFDEWVEGYISDDVPYLDHRPVSPYPEKLQPAKRPD